MFAPNEDEYERLPEISGRKKEIVHLDIYEDPNRQPEMVSITGGAIDLLRFLCSYKPLKVILSCGSGSVELLFEPEEWVFAYPEIEANEQEEADRAPFVSTQLWPKKHGPYAARSKSTLALVGLHTDVEAYTHTPTMDEQLLARLGERIECALEQLNGRT